MLTDVFGRSGESALVDRLRGRKDALSFVAAVDDQIVGHAIFHSVNVVEAPRPIVASALGLLAVHPTRRSMGTGSRLVNHGLAECRVAGAGLVFVLGAAAFYQRHGFVPAGPRGFRCRWRVPEGSLLVVEVVPGELAGGQGIVGYPREYDDE